MDKQFLPYVAASLFATRNYDGIIEAFDSRICDASMLVLDAYLIKRAYSGAIDVFDAAHERDPLSLIAWRSLFAAYEARGDADKTMEMAKSVLADKVLRDERGYWCLVDACHQIGNYKEAIHTYEALIDENPKDVTAWRCLSVSYAETGNYDGAIDKLESGLLENPKDFQLSWALVNVAIAKGDYSEAAQRLRRGIEKGQMDRGEAVQGLVKVYQKLSDQKGLISELERIAHKYPFEVGILHLLCEAYIEAGEYEDAISLSISKLATDNPAMGSYVLFRDLCHACKATGDHTKAIQVFESKAEVANFHYTFELSSILDLYDINHSSAGSKKVFEIIVGADDNVGVWAWPGLLRVTAGDRDFDAIVERMERLIDDGQMEASEDIAYELMNAYHARGDNNRAIAKLTKIAHRLPLFTWPWHILGEMYRRMGNPEEAINMYESNFRRLVTDYSVYQRLASLYLSTSNYLRVVECYEVLRERFPGLCDDLPRWLPLYMNATVLFDGWVPIDDRFREHLFWYPISEAHKGMGNNHKAHVIYDAMIDVYVKEENRFWFVGFRVTGANPKDSVISGSGFTSLPKHALLCALGEVYKAKQAVKPALETFQKAQKLLPSNSYIENVIAELKVQQQQLLAQNK
jgi:tetratricopeptide (TPR) repeat protein